MNEIYVKESAVPATVDFSMSEIWSSSWGKVNGFKGACWLAMLLYIVISFLTSVPLGAIITFAFGDQSVFGGLLTLFISSVVSVCLFTGFQLFSVNYLRGLPIKPQMILSTFPIWYKLLGALILYYVLGFIGIILLIIPGVYLWVAWLFTFLLIADKKMGVWEAMEFSRKAVTKHWFKYFFTTFFTGIAVGLSACLFFIPLIWTLPWGVNVFASLYRKALNE